MDIRNNPPAPQPAAVTTPRLDAPPTVGAAAAAPVAPGLPSPVPSVVALSEAARSLALRPTNINKDAEQGEDFDFATAQLELMIAMLMVYTPPTPPSPQELAQSVAEEVAAEREQQAEPERASSARPAVAGADTSAAATAGGAPAEPAAVATEAPTAQPATTDGNLPPAEAQAAQTAEPAGARRAQLYAPVDGGNGPRINLSA